MLQETAAAVDSIIEEFKGPAGLDIDGIHLFKSSDAVDVHWATASRHIGCMQVGSLVFVLTHTHVWPCLPKFRQTWTGVVFYRIPLVFRCTWQ